MDRTKGVKPTEFNGVKYLLRPEARWAVLLDQLCLTFETAITAISSQISAHTKLALFVQGGAMAGCRTSTFSLGNCQ